jgi:hypothetical protein
MDYNVHYKGMIIGNVQAPNDAAAHKLANQLYTQPVTVSRV